MESIEKSEMETLKSSDFSKMNGIFKSELYSRTNMFENQRDEISELSSVHRTSSVKISLSQS